MFAHSSEVPWEMSLSRKYRTREERNAFERRIQGLLIELQELKEEDRPAVQWKPKHFRSERFEHLPYWILRMIAEEIVKERKTFSDYPKDIVLKEKAQVRINLFIQSMGGGAEATIQENGSILLVPEHL